MPVYMPELASTDRLLGRVLLSIADDVAEDRLASPVERETAQAHGVYLRPRMRRILALLAARRVRVPRLTG